MISIFVIDPNNQIVRMASIEPTLDAVCTFLSTTKVRALSRTSQEKKITIIVPDEIELSKYTFTIDGLHGEFHGTGIITKLDEKKNLVKSDLSIEEVRSMISFHEIDGSELQHRRGLAWHSRI